MTEILSRVSKDLEMLADSIENLNIDNRTFGELYGWNAGILNKVEMSDTARALALRISVLNHDLIDEGIENKLDQISIRVVYYNSQCIQHLTNGNAIYAVSIFMQLMQWIELAIAPMFDWELLQEKGAQPKELVKKIRNIRDSLNEITPDKDALLEQIKVINDAYSTAESLPTDLQRLREVKSQIDSILSETTIQYGKIDSFYKDVERLTKLIEEKEKEANKLVEKCEEAYKITTTQGLAAAFELRARKLTNTVSYWVVGLVVALVTGGWLGSNRFEILSKSLNSQNPHWGVIWMQFSLSVIGFAAPLWLAWLATKQIGQRFRLAEDYAFKASVAKAYEGYRKEAVRIDEKLEERLFSSALTRLDEPPLRLIDIEKHNTPYQELFNSEIFQKLLMEIPDLKTKVFEIIGRAGDLKNIMPLNNSKSKIED